MSEIPTHPEVTITPAEPRSKVERDGLHDGSLGQTWQEYLRILTARAREKNVDDACATLKQRELQVAEQQLAEEIESRDRADDQRVEEEYALVAKDRDRRPAAYSAPWGRGLLLFSALLVAADFPLTRQIVSAMSIGTDDVWTWEQLFVTSGLVVISLFFKLLADPFTQPLYLMTPAVRRTMQTVSIVGAIVLMGGIIYMLFSLGEFRANAVAANTSQPVTVEEDFGATTTSAPAEDDPAAREEEARAKTLANLRKTTFIVLGLTLPILGGIFASVGMARLHNASRFANLTCELAEQRARYEASARRAKITAAEVRILDYQMIAIEKRDPSASVDAHTYLHSYETGLSKPDLERGRLGMATRLRNMVEKWTDVIDQSQNRVGTEIVSAQGLNSAKRDEESA